jgi:lysosomal Pro-X carboxypeptidase
MVMPMCTGGEHDMFERRPFNMTYFSEECHKKFNVYPQPDAARVTYGGDRLQAASNIVFSNGLKDPWAGGH